MRRKSPAFGMPYIDLSTLKEKALAHAKYRNAQGT
jgi:hypothetical protein